MKRIATILILSAVVMTCLTGCSNIKWEEFSSADGGFKVLMPDEVESQTVPSRTVLGVVNNYVHTALSDDAAFLVSYTDIPAGIPIDVEAGLEGGVKNSTAGYTNVDFKYSKDVEIDGYPGKEFRFTGTQQGIDVEYVSRTYIVDRRFYQIAISGMKDGIKDKTIDKFFNSFELD